MTKRQLKMRGGLPREAFAIAGEPEDPDTWRLPHHRKSIRRALRGAADIERTVDWNQVAAAVGRLSPLNPAERIAASPEEILGAAAHLAAHYRMGNKSLPDILAALV